jgi:hypothetical protein
LQESGDCHRDIIGISSVPAGIGLADPREGAVATEVTLQSPRLVEVDRLVEIKAVVTAKSFVGVWLSGTRVNECAG